MTTRRSFITGLVAFVAAPAIVRAGSLMQVKAERLPSYDGVSLRLITDYVPSDPVRLDVLYGSLRLGDIVMFEGVEAVDRWDKRPTGQLRQFVITANEASERTIYPPIVTEGRYRTVVERPDVLIPNRVSDEPRWTEFPNSGDNALGLVPATT